MQGAIVRDRERSRPVAAEESRFFEYGEAVLEACDFKSRQARVRLCAPCTLFQAVSPHLLGAGYIDDLKIRDPAAVWLPKLTQARIVPTAAGLSNLAERVNVAIKEEVDRILRIFSNMQSYLVDPSDLVPLLPLGTYVTFTFRCRVDDIPKLLEGIDSVSVVGVPELQWAMATVLYQALADFETVTTRLPGHESEP